MLAVHYPLALKIYRLNYRNCVRRHTHTHTHTHTHKLHCHGLFPASVISGARPIAQLGSWAAITAEGRMVHRWGTPVIVFLSLYQIIAGIRVIPPHPLALT